MCSSHVWHVWCVWFVCVACGKQVWNTKHRVWVVWTVCLMYNVTWCVMCNVCVHMTAEWGRQHFSYHTIYTSQTLIYWGTRHVTREHGNTAGSPPLSASPWKRNLGNQGPDTAPPRQSQGSTGAPCESREGARCVSPAPAGLWVLRQTPRS